MALIQTHIHGGVEVNCPVAPPSAKFHLVVRICTSRIESDGLPSLHVNPDITLPQVAMDQGWGDLATIRLQRTQESRNDHVEDLLASGIVLGPKTVSYVVHFDEIAQLVRVESSPAPLPGYHALDLPAYSTHRETKHARWGGAEAMELGDSCGERHGLGGSEEVHVVEIAQVEIYLGIAVRVLAVSGCVWNKLGD